ncbi:FAD/NAD(P)-binding oxidoreductase [Haloechinothrix salitolerans]|uniref:NAD(P)/FAD-dependent oxidoreductase n=1 Tax=Haloechinothrix salitolerans TaxID=926830 RepID=A0ABW2C491_9PSEU
MSERVVIVGASIGGIRTAAGLRKEGHAGEIVLVAPDAARPYDRPPLSKQVLQGTWEPEQASLGDPSQDFGVEVRTTRAVRLERDARKVVLATGEVLGYDRLVIATGATPKRFPERTLAGVHVLRSMQDCLGLREDLMRGGPLVVIGGGFIGAEVASAARGLDVPVCLVEAARAPMHGVLDPATAELLLQLHRERGVEIHCGVGVARLEGDGRVSTVVLSDGRRLHVDAVAVGIGVTPNTDWLEGSGLRLHDGVVTDQFLTATVDGTVLAVGDVARWYDPRVGRHVRIEHWTNAAEQAATVAHNIAHPDNPRPHDRMPYFWSDQHGAKIQTVGHVDPSWKALVVPGDRGLRRAVLHHDGIWVHSALAVNWPQALAVIRRGLDTELEVDQARRQLEELSGRRVPDEKLVAPPRSPGP